MSFAALDSALLGPLFVTDAMRQAFSDEARLRAMLRCEVALAGAQAALGLAPAGLGDALASFGVQNFDMAALGQATALAGVPTIPFVKALQDLLAPDYERHVHKGATTQDIADTALVLMIGDGLALLQADLNLMLPALALMARKHRATPCIGRTYGQHAAPVSFGFKVAVWASAVAEVACQYGAIRARIMKASLAGPVGTLAALGAQGPAVVAGFAGALDLGVDALAWHTRRDRMAELGSWLARLIGALAKMASDIVHLASTEVGEVAEPHVKGRGGSSAMPHKRNPVGCTLILAAQAAAPGHVTTLLNALGAAHERPAGAWHGEWHALPALFGLASGAMREALALAQGLVIDEARMRSNINLTHGMIFADAAAARLMAALGREGAHKLVERAADEVRRKGISLQDVLAAMPEAAAARDLAAAFDLAPAVAAAALWTDRALVDLPGSI
ncbi:MAG: adenylosuccinate lyase family protein [Hyphomicrobiales bacterium]|nr:adenylosuccinate lyase family protein [Hyphomicrobiales bacterium]